MDVSNYHIPQQTSTETTSKGAAIVTGASHGIRRAIAIQLAKDGYAVTVNDIPKQSDAVDALVQEISTAGRSIAVLGDVSKEEDVQSMITKAVKQLGDLQVVSCADHVAFWSSLIV
jgi:NAD(P)-dependent dehydrogenase (short-subunit alcohol dehydrogenase family)